MSTIGDILFFRKHHVCPRWLCWTFDNWIRRRLQNPDQIIKPYVREGNTVVDVGPGAGFFTIPLARLVGDSGQVIAVDIQDRMLTAIRKRAEAAGLSRRVVTQLASQGALGISVGVNFILAFWMAHEVPGQSKFFAELQAVLKRDGLFLLVEPKLHVSPAQFEAAINTAQNVGFRLLDRPDIPLSLAALLAKN